MREIKCDLCKKKITDKPVVVGLGIFETLDLCRKCGAPILNFLKKHQIDIDNKKKDILTKSI